MFLPFLSICSTLFFSDDTAPTEIYTLSLHDALPISTLGEHQLGVHLGMHLQHRIVPPGAVRVDRKSTRLNSSHVAISYAVFCLKKKKREKRKELRPKVCRIKLENI